MLARVPNTRTTKDVDLTTSVISGDEAESVSICGVP